jgi:hypothetical protein
MGALGADFTFNGSKAYADWTVCAQSGGEVPKGQVPGSGDPWAAAVYDMPVAGLGKVVAECNVVNQIRAAFSQMGLGMGSGQGEPWGAADQAAMRQVCSYYGIGGWGCDKGMPAKDNLLAIESAIQRGDVIGDQPIPALQKQNGQFITTGEKGLSTASMLAIGAGALLLLGGLAVASKQRGKRTKKA